MHFAVKVERTGAILRMKLCGITQIGGELAMQKEFSWGGKVPGELYERWPKDENGQPE